MSSVFSRFPSFPVLYGNFQAVCHNRFFSPLPAMLQNKYSGHLSNFPPEGSGRHKLPAPAVLLRFSASISDTCPALSEVFPAQYSHLREGSIHQTVSSGPLFCGVPYILFPGLLFSSDVPQMLPVLQVLRSSFYLPLSAIKSSISCSLIPTIASPRSSESSASIL